MSHAGFHRHQSLLDLHVVSLQVLQDLAEHLHLGHCVLLQIVKGLLDEGDPVWVVRAGVGPGHALSSCVAGRRHGRPWGSDRSFGMAGLAAIFFVGLGVLLVFQDLALGIDHQGEKLLVGRLMLDAPSRVGGILLEHFLHGLILVLTCDHLLGSQFGRLECHQFGPEVLRILLLGLARLLVEEIDDSLTVHRGSTEQDVYPTLSKEHLTQSRLLPAQEVALDLTVKDSLQDPVQRPHHLQAYLQCQESNLGNAGHDEHLSKSQ